MKSMGGWRYKLLLLLLLLLLLASSLLYLLTAGVERFLWFHFDHIQTHTTVGRTPLDGGSVRRRDLYLTAQTLYKANIDVPGWIRTHDPSKHSAADLCLRQQVPWDQRKYKVHFLNLCTRWRWMVGFLPWPFCSWVTSTPYPLIGSCVGPWTGLDALQCGQYVSFAGNRTTIVP
jgi:hypothetical protein